MGTRRIFELLAPIPGPNRLRKRLATGEAADTAWLARAFLEAALHLCEGMQKKGDFGDSGERNRIPLLLCHHSLELLYKAAIVDAGKSSPRTHDVIDLRKKCLGISDCRFELPEWVEGGANPSGSLFPELPRPRPDLHERLRYVTDGRGRPLREPPRLEPETMKADLEELSRATSGIFVRLIYDQGPRTKRPRAK